MCGITGLLIKNPDSVRLSDILSTFGLLLSQAEIRGRDASGIIARSNQSIYYTKEPVSASKLLKTKFFEQCISLGIRDALAEKSGFGVIGHARLVTNGLQIIPKNNQPIKVGKILGIHNGIIVNHDQLWDAHGHIKKNTNVDTEIFMALFNEELQKTKSFSESARNVYAKINGTAAVALTIEDINCIILATNFGSLYYALNEEKNSLFFASEKRFLERVTTLKRLKASFGPFKICRLAVNSGCMINIDSLEIENFPLKPQKINSTYSKAYTSNSHNTIKTVEFSKNIELADVEIRRCTKCILPETMPFIHFNEQGVCNFCRNHEKFTYLGHEQLDAFFKKNRFKTKQFDCVVGFSGGRDSSYGLHYLVKELGLRPLAFTYDWGMVTDLARRNQAILCSKLGVEHVIVAPDIEKKRKYIRQNIEAWIKNPHLGLVPLFMAGDKQYFYHANRLAKDIGVPCIVMCENGKFERTHFKSGFAGINEGYRRAFNVKFFEKLKLFWFYGSHFLFNPSYLNSSLKDSLSGFLSSYFLDHNYTYLYDYIRWDEELINKTLIEEYDWEISPDSTTTWRIGDGTAAFYNYIYYTIAGFTENDTFRSKQIREGLISREDALRLVKIENQPRWPSLEWYAQQIGFELKSVILAINRASKLYDA